MSWKYLSRLPFNAYNNERPWYEIQPLPFSNHLKVYLFAGKDDIRKDCPAIHVYLELAEKLNEQNQFANIQRLLSLIYLETGLSTPPTSIPVDRLNNFDMVFANFGVNNCYNPTVGYHSTAPEPNHIVRVQVLAKLLSGLSEKNFEKFDNALNTYVWALDLMALTNPHLKYTLQMTLFLSSMNQLANKPVFCTEQPKCSKCGKNQLHQEIGEKQSVINLIRELITGDDVDQTVKMVSNLYGELRSSFLHAGSLSGMEKRGGFLSSFDKDSNKLVEDQMNILLLNRTLLKQFVVKRQEVKGHG